MPENASNHKNKGATLTPHKNNSASITPKQAAFLAFVVAGDNQSKAYRKAYNWTGKSKSALGVEASRLMKLPHIKTRYDELKSDSKLVAKSQQKLTKEWIISRLRNEADDPHNPSSVRVRSLEILAKSEKLFSDSMVTVVQHRSSEEIEKELQEKLKIMFGVDRDITLVK